jgi:membrane protein implicated in regulation of membrane protease activity
MSDAEETAGPPHSPRVRWLVRAAVLVAIVALGCVMVFLWAGFRAWSVGLGVFLGAPLLMLAMGLYLTAVIRDLKNRDVF